LKTCIITNSSKSHTFNSIFMHSTSIQTHSLKESEMLVSIEDLELSLRDSRCLTGQQLRRDMVGKLTCTPEKHGMMPWLIWMLSGHPPSLLVRDLNQTWSIGSEWSSGVKVTVQDYSTMKFLSQDGSDTVDILEILKNMLTHLLMLIKIHLLLLVLTLQLQREENNGERNGKRWLLWYQKWSIKMKLSSHMKLKSHSTLKLTSKEYGNIIELLLLTVPLSTLLNKVKSHRLKLTRPINS
jgi:hypothetical protein